MVDDLMIIATLNTPNYQFIGVGASVSHARLSLSEAWLEYQRERPGTVDFDEATAGDYWGPIAYCDVVPGCVIRDSEIYLDPRGVALDRCPECGKAQTPNSPDYANHFRGCSRDSS